MKLFILAFIVMLLYQNIYPQGNPTSYFQYTYDDAGNRISREFIVLTPRPLDSMPDSIVKQYGLITKIKPQTEVQEQNGAPGEDVSGKVK